MVILRRSVAGVSIAFLLACGDSEGAGGSAGSGGGSDSPAGPGATNGPATSGSSQTSSATTGSGGAPPGCDFTEVPGTTTETIDVGGTMRSYVLAVPASVDGKSAVPLVFGFHGF